MYIVRRIFIKTTHRRRQKCRSKKLNETLELVTTTVTITIINHRTEYMDLLSL